MTTQKYIILDGKQYAVMHDGWEPVIGRQRVTRVGLTGKTIIQDLTVSNRYPYDWAFKLKVYINDPPDSGWGTFADLQVAYEQATIAFTEHDDTLSHTATFLGQLPRIPRVPANIDGACRGVHYVPVQLKKVHQ